MTKTKKELKQEIEKNKNNDKVIIKQNKGITMKNAKAKYFAIFVIQINESYSFVRRKRINPIKRKVRYSKTKLFVFQPEFPTYSNGLKVYYFFDLEHGQLLFNKTSDNHTINSNMIDDIMSKNIISQLTSSLGNSKFAMNLLQIIFGGITGGMIGYIIGIG